MTTAAATSTHTPPPPRPEVRAKVRDLLNRSEAFHQLPPARQQQLARDTALVADALVGKPDRDMASVTSRAMEEQSTFAQRQDAVDAIGKEAFQAGAVTAGAVAAAQFMKQVNFVEFVSGLIDGVFNSIVTSNIQQMEAYAKMVSDVSKSLSEFRDHSTTPDDGQDHLVDQFPDVFDIGVDAFSDSPKPQLKLRDGVDQDDALSRVNQSLGGYVPGGIDSIDMTDPAAQAKLIDAARDHIATARQQLLATMVMMGLSRIVVTNGKIQAKILYDFNASSQRNMSRSAQAMDFARENGQLARLTDGEGEHETSDKGQSKQERTYESGKSNYTGTYDADYYTKGKYKFSQRPVMQAMSVAADQQSDVLTARANLAGNVEVNFKTDYLPLEKMASPDMIEAIQMRSKPIDQNRPVYKPTEAQPVPPGATPAAQPAAPGR
jgi:hypothetical protein